MSLTKVASEMLEDTGTMLAWDGSALTNVSSITKSTSEPAADTNPSGGVGSLWLRTTTGEMYCCTDATTDANVWTNIGDGSGNQPFTGMTATGGTITTDGDYKVHTFNSSGTFTISNVGELPELEYLVVAGGGGGSDTYGGGGAGGFRTATSHTITAQPYTITVGAGGAREATGSDSAFDTITSNGGGLASPFQTSGAKAGGSGGGGRSEGSGYEGGTGNEGGFSPSEGNDGGDGTPTGSGNRGGGGGGGAGAAGSNGSNSPVQGGNGGAGTASNITGSSVIYAGGGGGGCGMGTGTAGTGGTGGGGDGKNDGTTGGAGTVNTGGGGGGGGKSAGNSDGIGGSGGSGVVILRYKFQ